MSKRFGNQVDLICHVDAACDYCVHRLLEVDVLVVVVVVIAVDPVVDVRHSVKNGESHSRKHQGNKLKLYIYHNVTCFLFCHHSAQNCLFFTSYISSFLYSYVGSRGGEVNYKVCSSLSKFCPCS